MLKFFQLNESLNLLQYIDSQKYILHTSIKQQMSKQKTSRSDAFTSREQNCNQIASMAQKIGSTYKPWNKKPTNKCLQNNLVYAMYLPAQFKDQNVIRSGQYFGQYGAITSVISSIDDSQRYNTDDSSHVQSYITYSNQKDAAMAICAVNEIIYQCKTIRTTYGTNRLCSSFNKREKCTVRNCFYLHDQKSCINIQGPLKTDFQKQKLIAYEIVKNNLVYFASKIQSNKLNNQGSSNIQSSTFNSQMVHFPSIKSTIDTLIERKVILKAAFQQAYQQHFSSKKKMSSTVTKIEYIRYRTKTMENSNQTISKIETQQIIERKQKTRLKEKEKFKNQFIMSQIIASLSEDYQEDIKKTLTSSNQMQRREFQQIGLAKDNEALSIYWQIYDEKQFYQDDQLQTEQSQTASCSKETSHWIQGQQIYGGQEEKTLQNKKTENSFHQMNDITQIEPSKIQLVSRIQETIFKNPLVKMSKLQFARCVPLTIKQVEYQKVTSILRRNLIR